MTIKAKESIEPKNRPMASIDNALIISATWGDDTPSYFAVPQGDEGSRWIRVFRDSGAKGCAFVEAEVRELIARGTWIGIKITDGSPVAAWGRAIVSIE